MSSVQLKKQEAVLTSLFAPEPTRTHRRMLQIVEAAIKNYATIGVDKTTYDRIATTCKISRPLIQHYFQDKHEIFVMAIRYIRVNFQQLVVEKMSKAESAPEKLQAYVEGCFYWVKHRPQHAATWKLFYYYCGIDKRIRSMNSEMVQIGLERIRTMISKGVEEGKFTSDNIEWDAHHIQLLITSALLAISTEDFDGNLDSFKEKIVDQCLGILGAKRISA